MNLLALDVAASTGAALFNDKGLLVWAQAIVADDPTALVDSLPLQEARIVIERPQYRKGDRIDPDLIIDLALWAGRIGGVLEAQGRPVQYVTPAEWKGSVPKPVSHKRIAKVLNAWEAQVLDTVCKGLSKKAVLDIWDAAGIGLWALGRYR